MAIRDRQEKIMAVPEKGALRRFWEDEVMWRANALYHNDVLNFPVKLLTGSRMDDPVTPGRVLIAAASLYPATRIGMSARTAANAQVAGGRAFAGLKNHIGPQPAGSRLFWRPSPIPVPTESGRAAVLAAEREYLEKGLPKYVSAAASPVRRLAEIIFHAKAPALGTASRALVDATSLAAEAYAMKKVGDEVWGAQVPVNSVPVTVSSPAQTPPPPPPPPIPARVAMRMENDEIAMIEALKELQASGGTNNTEAVAAFRDRTSGIFRRAVKRIHPTLHGGVPYSTAYSAASMYPDEDLGKTAAESIRKTEEYVRGLNPMEWLEKKGDR